MPAPADQKDPPMPRAKTTPTNSAEPNAADNDLQKEVIRFGMVLITMVVVTALYAPREYSQRAFRMINIWKRDPEPAPEEDTPPAKRRAPRK
ncbi:hypothetical protein [Streptomyces sp. NPDC048521]|uniref:hypothetical protein n=1 Tax=Streptomyces sp. NPDC048521 TaxID=3365566 RepID=UPI003711353E